MFKKVLAKVGGGGANVETTLTNASVYPGGTVEGVIDITGGESAQQVEYVATDLVASAQSADSEYEKMVPFQRQMLTGAFELGPGAQYQVPLQLQVPWETPPNVISNQQLPNCFIGVRAELEIARSRDPQDVDPIYVYALPAHERLLQAFFELGFTFKDADFERERLPGSTLPFFQEIELLSPLQYARSYDEVEVTFLTGTDSMDVLLEVDKRGFVSSQDKLSRFSVGLDEVDRFDWANALTQQLAEFA